MRTKSTFFILTILIFIFFNKQSNFANSSDFITFNIPSYNFLNMFGIETTKDIYVSPDGNDKNSGMIGSPIKTFPQVLKMIQNDNKINNYNIILLSGIHQITESFTIQNSSKNITIKSISPRAAIIEGTQTLDKRAFTMLNNNIVKMPIKKDVYQLIVNNKAINLSHSEDRPFLMSTVKSFADITKYDNGKNKIGDKYYYKVGIDPKDINKVEIGSILRICSWWKEEFRNISKILNNENVVIIESDTQLFIDYAPYVGEQYCIYNSSKLLTPGSYYFRNQKKDKFVYYKLEQTETIDNINVKIPITDRLINIQNSSNINIKDIVFRFNTDKILLYTTPQANIDAVAAITCKNSQKILIENCEFYNTIGYAVSIKHGSSQCTVKGSYIHQTCGGIIIGEDSSEDKKEISNNITIENNLIYDIGYISWDGVGIILIHGNNCKIKHNTVMKTKYTGISHGWAWGFYDSYLDSNEITYNHIHHVMGGYLSDGAGVYTLGVQPDTKIAHNIIHDVVGAHEGMGRGIYFDTGSSYIDCFNNIIYGTQIGIFMGVNKSITIRNNIIAYTNDFTFSKLNKKDWIEDIIKNNLIYIDAGVLFENTVHNANIQINNNAFYGINNRPFKSSRHQSQPLYFVPYFKDPINGNFSFNPNQYKNVSRNLKRINFYDFTHTMKDQQNGNVVTYGPGIKRGEHLNYNIISEFNTSVYKKEFKNLVSKRFKQTSSYFSKINPKKQ